MTERPSWDSYYLGIAVAVAARADCTRRKAGTIIVKDNVIVGHGYNGAPPGKPGCLSDGACPRGRHFQPDPILHPDCFCGHSWPCPEYVKPLSSYDTGAGACSAVHSEANAIIRAGFARTVGATLYTVPGAPCDGCQRLIEGAGITRVVYPS